MTVLDESIKIATPDVGAPTRSTLPLPPGHGRIDINRVNGRSVATRCSAASPLKILTPRSQGNTASIVTSTYGGGLVGGDVIRVDLHASADTRTVLTTQASTKVYRTVGPPCRQELSVTLETDAIMICAPIRSSATPVRVWLNINA